VADEGARRGVFALVSVYSSDEAGLVLDPLDSLLVSVPVPEVTVEVESPPVVREPSLELAGGGVLVARPVPLPLGFCVPPSTTWRGPGLGLRREGFKSGVGDFVFVKTGLSGCLSFVDLTEPTLEWVEFAFVRFFTLSGSGRRSSHFKCPLEELVFLTLTVRMVDEALGPAGAFGITEVRSVGPRGAAGTLATFGAEGVRIAETFGTTGVFEALGALTTGILGAVGTFGATGTLMTGTLGAATTLGVEGALMAGVLIDGMPAACARLLMVRTRVTA
jgi:hypothetical protein